MKKTEIQRLTHDSKRKKDLILQKDKGIKGLQAKLQDLKSEEAEEKKRLQKIVVKREDTIDRMKYDL